MGPAGRVGVADALGGQGLTQAGADVVRDEQQRQVGRRARSRRLARRSPAGVPDRFASTRRSRSHFLVWSATLRCRLVDRRPAAPPLIRAARGRQKRGDGDSHHRPTAFSKIAVSHDEKQFNLRNIQRQADRRLSATSWSSRSVPDCAGADRTERGLVRSHRSPGDRLPVT